MPGLGADVADRHAQGVALAQDGVRQERRAAVVDAVQDLAVEAR